MALAAGKSASEAARELGVSLSTVQRRMADPDFRKFVADLRNQMLERALNRVTDNLTRAADTLVGLLEHDNPVYRLRAARSLLTLGLKLHEAVELTDRMRQVEEELERRRGSYS